jgi:hypothetical protein
MTKKHYPTQPVRVLGSTPRVLGSTLARPDPTPVRPGRHPPPPQVLAEEEQELWDAIHREYEIEGNTVMSVLLKACNASATERMAMEAIRRDGVMVDGKPHPLLKSAAEARNSFLACLRALGIDLGPAR